VKEDKKRETPEKRQDDFSKAKPNAEKETLGDLDIFANLKDKKAKGKKEDEE